MTDFTEVKKLMDETGNAVSQLRQSQEQAIAEFKKHGETLGETKTKQDLIEKRYCWHPFNLCKKSKKHNPASFSDWQKMA